MTTLNLDTYEIHVYTYCRKYFNCEKKKIKCEFYWDEIIQNMKSNGIWFDRIWPDHLYYTMHMNISNQNMHEINGINSTKKLPSTFRLPKHNWAEIPISPHHSYMYTKNEYAGDCIIINIKMKAQRSKTGEPIKRF